MKVPRQRLVYDDERDWWPKHDYGDDFDSDMEYDDISRTELGPRHRWDYGSIPPLWGGWPADEPFLVRVL
jgi:hypothetical protein